MGTNLFSRRTFLCATASSAALPAVAHAAADRDPVDPPQLTIEEQTQACVDMLKALLKRMHPDVETVHEFLTTGDDGTFRLQLQGARSYLPYTGPGVYDVACTYDGGVGRFLVERDDYYEPSGKFGYERYLAWPMDGGTVVCRTTEFCGPLKVVRKVREGRA